MSRIALSKENIKSKGKEREANRHRRRKEIRLNRMNNPLPSQTARNSLPLKPPTGFADFITK